MTDQTAPTPADELTWTDTDRQDAGSEGWDLFDSEGSANGTPQLSKIDDPGAWGNAADVAVPETGWQEDNQAWMHVRGIPSPLHTKALAVLAKANPKERAAIEDWYAENAADVPRYVLRTHPDERHLAGPVGPESPCEVRVGPANDEREGGGGVSVEVFIPTYSGGVTLTTTVERSIDGDWTVFLPDTTQYDVHNNIAYLGAPDDEYPRSDGAEPEAEAV